MIYARVLFSVDRRGFPFRNHESNPNSASRKIFRLGRKLIAQVERVMMAAGSESLMMNAIRSLG